MKKSLLYVIAIPVGLIASVLLPAYFSKVFEWFIFFDVIREFLDNYFLKFISGWIAVGVTALIVPKFKITFGAIMLALNIIASCYMFSKGDVFNYLFVVGGIVALILVGKIYPKLNENG
jgi:hypothetical protein